MADGPLSPMIRKGSQMFRLIAQLFQNDHGATAIEYGLIAALIAVAAIAAFQLVGTSLSDVFHNAATFI
jgi:pilus assembly protein Flp/PilA